LLFFEVYLLIERALSEYSSTTDQKGKFKIAGINRNSKNFLAMRFVRIKKNQDNCLIFNILLDWVEKSENLLY